MAVVNQTNTLSTENTWSDVVELDGNQRAAFSISGTFSGDVTLQRRFNQTGDWRDVATYTAAIEKGFEAEVGMEIRIGFKTGDYTSGSAVIDIKTDEPH